MNLLKIKIAHRSYKVRMNFGKLKEARTKVFSKALIKNFMGTTVLSHIWIKYKLLKCRLRKTWFNRNTCKKNSWELLLTWAQRESTVWYDCQEGQCDFRQHLVECKVHSEVAEESIVLNIPWTYSVAIRSAHNTLGVGAYLKLPRGE